MACFLLLTCASSVSGMQAVGPKAISAKGRVRSGRAFEDRKKTTAQNVLAPATSVSSVGPATAAVPLHVEVPPSPGTVTLENGLLTIKADNSDLQQILQQVAALSGMVVDGYGKRLRVFGVYGPRDPQTVLADLLADSGYNFIMVGVTDQGTPKQLTLTPRAGGPSPPSAAPAPVAAARANPEPEYGPQHPGPGAVMTVPPARPENPEVRREQRLQRLQQMHDRQVQPEPKP